jgi:pyridoxamine 5'-phosphate oxidase
MAIVGHVKSLRREYSGESLDESTVEHDPFLQFSKWFREVVEVGISDPNAMVLATASREGKPSARVVLLRGLDRNGLVFYTNYDSRKAKDILRVPKVAVVFFWSELSRQVRVEGTVKKVSAKESDEYFRSRPEGSQLATWASNQTEVISGREELDRLFDQFKAKFTGRPVPRPKHWGGFRIFPSAFEFWQGRPNRLHDRILYHRDETGRWVIERLAP